MTIAIHKKVVKCSSANKSYQLQYCKQKLSLATCAHKSYRSFDAILRFFLNILINIQSRIFLEDIFEICMRLVVKNCPKFSWTEFRERRYWQKQSEYNLDFYEMIGCWWNIQVLMQLSGVKAMFGCCCNVLVLLQCSRVDAVFGCWCNIWGLMQCSVVGVMFGCFCIFPLLMQ